MTETSGAEQVRPPVIVGAAGDIGRTALQQLLADGITPAGIVLTAHRLEDDYSRTETAGQISRNFSPDGEDRVLRGVRLLKNPLLRVGDVEIPVFTPESQHEIFQEGHPVIDATGNHKKRDALEPFLEAGAGFVLVTCPIKEKEGVQTVVYGINSSDEVLAKAAEDGLLSTSSCTTTAVSSLLGPILRSEALNPTDSSKILAAMIDVTHARTKSNDPNDIANNFKLSPSGAAAEIPRVLGVDPDELAFNVECTRSDVVVGSKANILLVFPSSSVAANDANLSRLINHALREDESACAIDPGINATKDVIGRTESVVANLSELKVLRMRDDRLIATGIYGFYDNVAGYTRSALDSYRAMSAASAA